MTDRLTRIGRVTVPLKLAALFGFLGTMFVGWHRVSVEVAGVVDVQETSNGWHGWGLVAGIVALILLALVFGEASMAAPTTGRALPLGLLSLALVVATALAVFGGQVDVGVAGVGVEVQETLWGAWLGLALAAVTAGAYVAELIAQLPERRPRGLASTTHV